MPISRSYRPQFFQDVTGQQHITETLRKEVVTGMLGHAFLFSGPRGVGKTTTARIFAKALLSDVTKDGEPDASSPAVKEIDHGKCIDLLEVDAASHTGVDNIRETIIEHVQFPPVRWKRKVYIIDECHMLSPSAWNAMLKTLEEPPEYAFFILATTELHKVPETIKSRCQRFEFRRIEPEPMRERIRFLAKQEQLTIDDSVIDMIVQTGDGCLRDAESTLEQLASLGETTITPELAELILPHSDIPKASEVLNICSKRDVGAGIATIRELMNEGLSPAGLLTDLLTVTRKLIQAEDPEERTRLNKSDRAGASIVPLLDMFSRSELSDITLLLMERRRDVKSGIDPAFALELAVLAIAGGLLPHAEPVSSGTKLVPEPPPDNSLKAQAKTNSDQESTIEESSAVEIVPPLVDLHDVRTKWNMIIKEVEKENRSLPFILKITRPERIQGHTIILNFQYIFHKEKIIGDVKTKKIVEQAARTVLGIPELLIDGEVVGNVSAGTVEREPQDVVTRVLDTFGGSVVE